VSCASYLDGNGDCDQGGSKCSTNSTSVSTQSFERLEPMKPRSIG
jgi:hypothetical protein